MKAVVLSIAIYLATFSIAKSQEKLTDDQKEVETTVTKIFQALADRDSLALKTFCTADILLLEHGRIWNLDSLIQKAIARNTGKDFQRSNKLEFIKTSTSGDNAWASYNLYSDVTRDGKHANIHFLETVVLLKEKKQWKVKVLHSTLLKRNVD